MSIFKTIQSDSKHYLGGLYHRTGEHHVFLFASGISFSVFLCVIPFVLIIFAIVGRLVDSADLQDSVNHYIVGVIPYEEYAAFVIRFVGLRIGEFIAFRGIAGVVGTLGLLFAASGLFSSMRTALNTSFRITDGPHALLRKLKDLAMTLIVVLFVLLSVFVIPGLEALRKLSFGPEAPAADILNLLQHTAIVAITLAIVFAVFLILYRYAPSRLIPWRTAIVSSISATLLWVIAKESFGFYISHFVTLQRVYGAYLFIVVIALWLYYSSLVLLLGAEIGQLYRERRASKA